jgi:hypothetical protein
MPGEMLDFVAGPLETADPSQVKRYTERAKTRFEHQWEIRRAQGFGISPRARRMLASLQDAGWHPWRRHAPCLP